MGPPTKGRTMESDEKAPPTPEEVLRQLEQAEREGRIRRGRHVVRKGHRIEIHRDNSVVQVRCVSRRAPERNKYAEAPKGTVAKDKRERLVDKRERLARQNDGAEHGDTAGTGE